MAAAVYAKSSMNDLDLRAVLDIAEDVREATQTPGWQRIAEAIDQHRDLMLQQLTHRGTKPDDVRYLQGLVAGLASMRDAADTIVAYAGEREAEARQSLQEQIA